MSASCSAFSSHSAHPRSGTGAIPYRETFRRGARQFRLDLFTGVPQQLIRCGFPRDDGPRPALVPMRIFNSDQSAAWYAAVYRTGVKPDEPLVLAVSPGPLGTRLVTIDLAGKQLTHRIPQLPEQP